MMLMMTEKIMNKYKGDGNYDDEDTYSDDDKLMKMKMKMKMNIIHASMMTPYHSTWCTFIAHSSPKTNQISRCHGSL